jgi:hypothetical protein
LSTAITDQVAQAVASVASTMNTASATFFMCDLAWIIARRVAVSTTTSVREPSVVPDG